MENKLRNLYALQRIDTNLDELEEMKGDLPSEIRELEEKAADLKARKAALEETMKSAFVMRDGADSEIVSLREKVERFEISALPVRSLSDVTA